MCSEAKNVSTGGAVADFSAVGFGGPAANRVTEAHARLGNLKALALQSCVGATYSSATNQICFSVPIYGDVCVTSPVSVPVDADLKACIQTCGGSILPTGVQATIYLNGSQIYSGTVAGSC